MNLLWNEKSKNDVSESELTKITVIVSEIFKDTKCCSDECGELIKSAHKACMKTFPRATRNMSDIEKELHKAKKIAFIALIKNAISAEISKIEKRERLLLGGRI